MVLLPYQDDADRQEDLVRSLTQPCLDLGPLDEDLELELERSLMDPGNEPRPLLQIELLDRRSWRTRAELANAIFEWIEAFYNPVRRHSALGYHSPIDFENLHTPATGAA